MIAYDFCTEMFRDRAIFDATFKAVVGRFGEQGVIDLVAVSGYYSIVSKSPERRSLPFARRRAALTQAFQVSPPLVSPPVHRSMSLSSENVMLTVP
jgi:4-carboxymuconolactone decarboxylase